MNRSGRDVALLFPGQGSQVPGMGREFMQVPSGRRVFEEAGDVLGWSVCDLCALGTEKELAGTARVQPALLTVSIAAFRLLEDELEIEPRACLGHSLGEYSALVAAGALRFSDALLCVARRGEFMDAALPAGTGGMAAVLGLGAEEVMRACRQAADGDVLTVANLNAPRQVVVSGHLRAIDRCEPLLKAAGARAVIRLPVSSAFHSQLMLPAARRLQQVLEGIPISPPRRTVLSNVTGRPYRGPEEIRELLVRQVSSPVQWEDCVRWVIDSGIADFFELGPGGVLAGLNRSIDRTTRTLGIDGPAALSRIGSPQDQEKAS